MEKSVQDSPGALGLVGDEAAVVAEASEIFVSQSIRPGVGLSGCVTDVWCAVGVVLLQGDFHEDRSVGPLLCLVVGDCVGVALVVCFERQLNVAVAVVLSGDVSE